MRIRNVIFISFLVVLIIPSFSYAQLFKIGVGGGLTQVVGPESYTNDISEAGFGFSTEWNAGIVAKLDLPIVPVTPRAFILYHSFSGSGDQDILTKGTVLTTYEYSQSIFETGLGVQYNFIPIPVGIDPYIALDIAMNSFGDFTTKVGDMEEKASGESRFGGGVGLGAEVSIVPMVNIDLFVSYKLFNLVGKNDGEETISAVSLDAFVMFNFL